VLQCVQSARCACARYKLRVVQCVAEFCRVLKRVAMCAIGAVCMCAIKIAFLFPVCCSVCYRVLQSVKV